MAKYRKKPVTVEAFHLGYERFPKWAEEALLDGRLKIAGELHKEEYLLVKTLEGTMRANPGVYIVKGVDGELYPCQYEIFKRTYERVD